MFTIRFDDMYLVRIVHNKILPEYVVYGYPRCLLCLCFKAGSLKWSLLLVSYFVIILFLIQTKQKILSTDKY